MNKNKIEKNVESKPKAKKAYNKYLIFFSIFLTIFIIYTVLVLTNKLAWLDQAAESFIIGIRSDHLTNIMTIFTNIGGGYCLTAISLLLLAVVKNKKKVLTIIINLVIVFLTSQIVKLILRRSRPSGVFLAYANGYSYPSGHSMVSMAYYTFIAYLLCKNSNNKLFKILTIIITTLIVLLIGFSRIYLGVHYITDVIGGYLLSVTYLMIFLNFINHRKDVK